MRLSLVVSSCFTAALSVPLICGAQSMGSLARARAIDPQHNSAVVSVRQLQIPEKAQVAFNKGIRLLAEKNSAGSILEFEKAVEAFPDYYEAYDEIGDAELSVANWRPAEAAYRKAIELSGGSYARPHFGLALILCNQEKQLGEAEQAARRGLAVNPADAKGNFVLSWVLYSATRLQDAEKSAQEAVLDEPMFAGARLLLAQIHLRENNLTAAVQDLDNYLSFHIDSPFNDKILAVRAEALRGLSEDANGGAAAEKTGRGPVERTDLKP